MSLDEIGNGSGAVTSGPGAAPDPVRLDLLVVGGGPAGTAAAFRAAELGLATLVVDYDDLMKRIRDYSKDKLILPGFGGGDRQRFPAGGELISALRFAAIDKDDLCAAWKRLYRQHGVAARTGIELTGLGRRPDGAWTAEVWDHGARRAQSIAAHFVALALGRGVPRRFDIPGDTDGIAFCLRDPALYVGRPACVIGGGTSAAEAVIAISNAKAEAGDETAVYWSYRGERMPRVSKALAEVFFEAYVGNGNIRYYPRSEPAAVVVGEDKEEYLAVRIDRRRMSGRPAETSHLEFPKAGCVACIGEDLPAALLESIGVPMVAGGPRGKRRLVVNRYLESRRPGLFLIGDLLSQAYFETDDFDAPPEGLREVIHRGNIKSALRDGVLVAQVVAQRLAGATEIDVAVGDAAEVDAGGALELGRPARPPAPAAGTLRQAPEGAEQEEEAAPDGSRATLIRLLPGGVEEEMAVLAERSTTTLGRGDCDLSFPDDSLLAPAHASVSHTADGYFLRDDGSDAGVFLELAPAAKRPLADGDLLRAGRQFLLLTRRRGEPVLVHYDATGGEVDRHPLADGTRILGRDAPDVVLDRDDATLSRRHLAVSVAGGVVSVKDLKSANGTLLRVKNAVELAHGDRFRIGRQRLLFSSHPDASLLAGHEAPPRQAAAASERPATGLGSAVGAPVAGEGAVVTFFGSDKTLAVEPGETLCEALEAAGIEITAECHSGICGSDPIRIRAGGENVAEPADEQERDTLEDLCGLDAADCRLACKVRLKGPIEIEILEP